MTQGSSTCDTEYVTQEGQGSSTCDTEYVTQEGRDLV